MKVRFPKFLYRILTTLAALTVSFEICADGHDRVIPISDDGILAIQIAQVMLSMGAVFLFAALLRYLFRKRDLAEPKSYILIVLVTLFLAGFLEWIADEKNLPADIADIAITPITILILLFAPVLLYRISPKKNSTESKNMARDIN